jgi:hypothetical protein
MTRAFNIEGLVRLQNYMGGKTLSDAQFFAVLNADVVEMIDGEESTTKRRYFRIAENDESITFSCILGSSQQQMVVTKATKQLIVSTTGIGGAIAPGSITSEMLADKAVTRKKLDDAAVGSEALGNASVTSVKIRDGDVTSKKLAPGLDVSGLFFILPEGTQFPYTLTEEDKTKLSNARFLIIKNKLGVSVFTPSQLADTLNGAWFSHRNQTFFYRVAINNDILHAPESTRISDSFAVRYGVPQALNAEQKLQARTNIGAAEDPNTSGDPQVTLEEPPVADEKTIP